MSKLIGTSVYDIPGAGETTVGKREFHIGKREFHSGGYSRHPRRCTA